MSRFPVFRVYPEFPVFVPRRKGDLRDPLLRKETEKMDVKNRTPGKGIEVSVVDS